MMGFKSMLDLNVGDLVYIHNPEGFYHQHGVIKKAFTQAGWTCLRLVDHCECEYEIKSLATAAHKKLFHCRDVMKELEDAGVTVSRRPTLDEFIRDFGFTEEEINLAFSLVKEIK